MDNIRKKEKVFSAFVLACTVVFVPDNFLLQDKHSSFAKKNVENLYSLLLMMSGKRRQGGS